MDTNVLLRGEDHWTLPFAQFSVTRCCLDYAFTLFLSSVETIFEVRIEEDFMLRDGGKESAVIQVESDPVKMGPALRVWGKTVKTATAFDDGRLEIEFEDAMEVVVPASKDYESWQVAGPSGLRMVSMPGGELAIWGMTSTSPDRDGTPF